MVDMETNAASGMKLEIRGFAAKLRHFTGLENNLLPRKQRPP
jgi:hypothetical protein